MFTLLPEQENEISISEAEALLSGKLAHRTTACLVGCGLGTSREAQKLVEYLLARSKAPMVIDADGLNAIAAEPEMLSKAQEMCIRDRTYTIHAFAAREHQPLQSRTRLTIFLLIEKLLHRTVPCQ